MYMLVAEYVPVLFNLDVFAAVKQVKQDNGLERGSLREARYLKQIKWRRDAQRTTHMVMGFTNHKQVNLAIRNGLIIEGKRVTFRKYRADPNRCLKCQKIGAAHRASDCKATHNVCGRCAAAHKTKECTATDVVQFKCVNCDAEGHTATDRNCPHFINKLRSLHARFPDYRYRYYPTHEPDTWEMEDYGLGIYEGQQSAAAPHGEANTQQMYRYSAANPGNRPPANSRDRQQTCRGFVPGARDNGWAGMPPHTRTNETHSLVAPAPTLRQATLDKTMAPPLSTASKEGRNDAMRATGEADEGRDRVTEVVRTEKGAEAPHSDATRPLTNV